MGPIRFILSRLLPSSLSLPLLLPSHKATMSTRPVPIFSARGRAPGPAFPPPAPPLLGPPPAWLDPLPPFPGPWLPARARRPRLGSCESCGGQFPIHSSNGRLFSIVRLNVNVSLSDLTTVQCSREDCPRRGAITRHSRRPPPLPHIVYDCETDLCHRQCRSARCATRRCAMCCAQVCALLGARCPLPAHRSPLVFGAPLIGMSLASSGLGSSAHALSLSFCA